MGLNLSPGTGSSRRPPVRGDITQAWHDPTPRLSESAIAACGFQGAGEAGPAAKVGEHLPETETQFGDGAPSDWTKGCMAAENFQRIHNAGGRPTPTPTASPAIRSSRLLSRYLEPVSPTCHQVTVCPRFLRSRAGRSPIEPEVYRGHPRVPPGGEVFRHTEARDPTARNRSGRHVLGQDFDGTTVRSQSSGCSRSSADLPVLTARWSMQVRIGAHGRMRRMPIGG